MQDVVVCPNYQAFPICLRNQLLYKGQHRNNTDNLDSYTTLLYADDMIFLAVTEDLPLCFKRYNLYPFHGHGQNFRLDNFFFVSPAK